METWIFFFLDFLSGMSFMQVNDCINSPAFFINIEISGSPMSSITGHLNQKDVKYRLTYLFPMHSFSTPWKHQKTVKVFWCFLGVEKGYIGSKWDKTTKGYSYCLSLFLVVSNTGRERVIKRSIFHAMHPMKFVY